MGHRIRQSVGLLAVFAIAMHAILFGAPMQAAATAVDPFSVICHSGPIVPAASGERPANQTPTKACDHCSLCFVAAALAGPDAILAGRLAPPAVLHELVPAAGAARQSVADSPHLPRGPPQRA